MASVIAAATQEERLSMLPRKRPSFSAASDVTARISAMLGVPNRIRRTLAIPVSGDIHRIVDAIMRLGARQISFDWRPRNKRGSSMPVLYEKRNHVGWLTLSRPEARNCWGDDFNEEITRVCDEMASDRDVRVAVVTGDEAGGAFSAGANLKDPHTHAEASMAEF